MCFHIDGDHLTEDAPKLMPLDHCPYSSVEYLREKTTHLQARQADLEATEAELKWQRQEFERQQAA